MSCQRGGADEEEPPAMTIHRSQSWTADVDEGDGDRGAILMQVQARLRSEDAEVPLGRKAVIRAAMQAKKQEITSPEEALERIFNLATKSAWAPPKSALKHVDSMELIGDSPKSSSLQDSDSDSEDGGFWGGRRRYFDEEEKGADGEIDDAFAIRPERVGPCTLPHVDSSELFSKMWGHIGSGWDSPRTIDSPTRSFDPRTALVANAPMQHAERTLADPPQVL